jgi:hypothetical protein
VLDRKGPKSTVSDLLSAVRENEKKLLSTLQSTPDELALLVSHAFQARQIGLTSSLLLQGWSVSSKPAKYCVATSVPRRLSSTTTNTSETGRNNLVRTFLGPR